MIGDRVRCGETIATVVGLPEDQRSTTGDASPATFVLEAVAEGDGDGERRFSKRRDEFELF